MGYWRLVIPCHCGLDPQTHTIGWVCLMVFSRNTLRPYALCHCGLDPQTHTTMGSEYEAYGVGEKSQKYLYN